MLSPEQREAEEQHGIEKLKVSSGRVVEVAADSDVVFSLAVEMMGVMSALNSMIAHPHAYTIQAEQQCSYIGKHMQPWLLAH